MYKKAKKQYYGKKTAKQCGGAAAAARQLGQVGRLAISRSSVAQGLNQSASKLETIIETVARNIFTKPTVSKFDSTKSDIEDFVKNVVFESIKIKQQKPKEPLKKIIEEAVVIHYPYNRERVKKTPAMENAEKIAIFQNKNKFITLITPLIKDAMQPVLANTGRRTTHKNSVRINSKGNGRNTIKPFNIFNTRSSSMTRYFSRISKNNNNNKN